MDDTSRGAIDAETPVNPYSLLEAVNRAGASANVAWLVFLALVGYLLIAVAGVSHKDLLLDSAVTLPILQVKIGLTRFFVLVPVLLVLLHVILMVQLVLLARKTLEFAASIRMLEPTDQRTHPLRLELDNFVLVQALAGPERSRLVGLLLHGVSWLSIVALPVLALLYVQLTFLPYHDAEITSLHRVALLADIGLIAFVGVFLWRIETSFFRAFLRTTLHHPLSFALTAALLVAAVAFSFFVATIPGESADAPASAWRQAGDRGYAYALAALGASPEGALLGLFPRNLSVTDTDLVGDEDAASDRPSINLRGRDLRFARLDRAGLHRADLTGANLEGASLAGTDLRGAFMGCADLNHLLLADSRRGAGCTHARGSDLLKARLAGARMAGIDLRGARLDEARMEGAKLAYALMSGASLARANLDRADLSSAWLQGASFKLASLQGADLSDARSQMADFGAALLQGANLSRAGLEAASLRGADLEGTSLQLARLQGADLSGARMQASDLKGTQVWRTKPPGSDGPALADLSQIALQPPTEDALTAFGASLAKLENAALKTRLTDAIAALSNATQSAAWATSPEQQLWVSFAKSGEATVADTYKSRLTDHLARLMCRPRFADGAVATGLARRAITQGFRGDVPALYDRLKSADCPAAAAVSPDTLRELATAAEALRETAPPALTQARNP
jgi:uncharacterized protein YjbI with pentapeptide repeats